MRRWNVSFVRSCALLALLVCAAWVSGCGVPTAFKQDAIDLEGIYRVEAFSAVAGEIGVTPKDGFTIENETATYDIRMIWVRDEYTALETEIFKGVTVASEEKYLLKRILLSPGYQDLDSGYLSESRENLSRDKGQSNDVTIESRYYQLREEAARRSHIFGAGSEILRCFATDLRNSERRLSDAQCRDFAGRGKIVRQAFRYSFGGKAVFDSNELDGMVRFETLSKIKHEGFLVTIQASLWSAKLTLLRTERLERP